ncbi:MAG: SDR family NAD(P)-dependent oxidoreductase [Desulfovibrionaceae bacterium]
MDAQEIFARLSGDYNPLHLSQDVSRRLLFGECVVHGIHLLLWALDQAASHADGTRAITALNVQFRSPVRLGREVALHFESREERWMLRVMAGNTLALLVRAELRPQLWTVTPVEDGPAPELECRELDAASFSVQEGGTLLRLSHAQTYGLFPNLLRIMPLDHVAILLATTRIVGMQCPGRHSLFSALALDFREGAPERTRIIRYRVECYDARISQLILVVEEARAIGRLTAFERPRPRLQAEMEDVRSVVSPRSFAGQRVLVVGGTRGLGEVAVKIFAAGGAEVFFTYYKNEATGAELAANVSSAAGVDVRHAALDICRLEPNFTDILRRFSPTQLYYFATPFIFQAEDGRFHPALFEKFNRYYLEGFNNCLLAVLERSADGLVAFWPSTTAIDELPGNMWEYAASKAAGEVLCHLLTARHQRLQIVIERFPRLPTDQTASVLPERHENPVPFIHRAALKTTSLWNSVFCEDKRNE